MAAVTATRRLTIDAGGADLAGQALNDIVDARCARSLQDIGRSPSTRRARAHHCIDIPIS